MEFPYLARVRFLLGDPWRPEVVTEAWSAVESELGFALPEDYKKILGLYGPVELNHRMDLLSPIPGRWNVADWIGSTSRAWAEESWEGEVLETDPRASLGISEMRFGQRGGLIPSVPTTVASEIVFMANSPVIDGWWIYVYRDYEFYEYRMNFSEWLYQYLICGDVVLYEPPLNARAVELRSLPMSESDSVRTWYGPDPGRECGSMGK
ncbi:SMI1/KNR4 family protein [Streptomyces sp. JH002]|uniref:SMI1/KNR4 family protein n=1 Tax=Streptomyces sp. JH002 TaxID=2763259 RepID=UPI003D806D14